MTVMAQKTNNMAFKMKKGSPMERNFSISSGKNDTNEGPWACGKPFRNWLSTRGVGGYANSIHLQRTFCDISLLTYTSNNLLSHFL